MKDISKLKQTISVTVGLDTYERFLFRTKHIQPGDDLQQEIVSCVGDMIQDGDVICVAESVVSVSQNRLFKLSEVEPGWLARFLAKRIRTTGAGLGYSLPETMQIVINQAGLFRSVAGALVAGVTRPLGRKGDFYRIIGPEARAVDGPTKHTMPPCDTHISLSPENPRGYSQELEQRFRDELGKDVEVIVVDANDIGVNVLGFRDVQQETLGRALCGDNPMGQQDQQTPVMVSRKSK